MNPFDRDTVVVSHEQIDVTAMLAAIGDDRAGASVVFSGMVRNHAPGKTDISHLEYEAYVGVVEVKIAEIIAEAAARWDVLEVRAAHRLGELGIRDVSVAVAVSSAHRAESFEAARYVIDELKKRAPIWKKEHWPGGAEWVREDHSNQDLSS
ncbi:MAG: molybdenum cofactor biosynthesis protein MoaE [Actinobacteria bacterium]|nr:molybdenum cofactor biosynthesis protein MoaE [Actinomycetota bacterium]